MEFTDWLLTNRISRNLVRKSFSNNNCHHQPPVSIVWLSSWKFFFGGGGGEAGNPIVMHICLVILIFLMFSKKI